LASHGYVVVGVNHTYETTVTVFGDGRVVAMNSGAVAGVLGPQTGPYEERFRQRATVCDYKAADLASVADTLGQLNAEHDGLLGGRLDFSRSHVSFMDLPWLPLLDESPVKPMLAATALEPRRIWRITCDVLLAFFGRHLNGAAHESVLDAALADYPELTFGPP
jgi:hypothetical protein